MLQRKPPRASPAAQNVVTVIVPPPNASFLTTDDSTGAYRFTIGRAPLSPPTTLVATAKSLALSPPGDSEQRLERRRKQCRVSQRRYRDKKGSVEYNLRLDVNSLRESVERLRQTRTLLESRLWSDRLSLVGSVRKAVEQYYVMFSHGLSDPSAGGYARKCHDVQVGFMHAFMDPDVVYGEASGVGNVIEQWRRYSVVHDKMWVRTLSAEVFGTREAPIAVVDGLLGVRMNRMTIEAVFPHIVGNEVLVQALVGKEIVYDTRTTYSFNERNQVVRQDLHVDFLSGLTKLLNSATTTSRVLAHSLILPSARLIGDDSDYQPPPSPMAGNNGFSSPEPESEDISPFELLDDDADDVGEVFAPQYAAPKSTSSSSAVDAEKSSSRLDLAYIMS